MKAHQVVILGSGPAGLTAALYTARAGLETLVLEGPTPGGQLIKTSIVENWPGIISIMGAQLIMDMKTHAQKCGALFSNETALKLEPTAHSCAITTNKQQIQAQAVIIAVGSAPQKLGCPGEDRYWGRGVTVCAICDAALYKNQSVVIVGGGNTAMQDALFMTKFTDKITIVHLFDTFTAAMHLQKPVLKNSSIKILYNSTVSMISGDDTHVTQVTITNKSTNQETIIPTAAVFLAIGSTPNTGFLKDSLDLENTGHIKTSNHTRVITQAPIFACGDVVDKYYRQAITAAASGCRAALDVQRYLEHEH